MNQRRCGSGVEGLRSGVSRYLLGGDILFRSQAAQGVGRSNWRRAAALCGHAYRGMDAEGDPVGRPTHFKGGPRSGCGVCQIRLSESPGSIGAGDGSLEARRKTGPAGSYGLRRIGGISIRETFSME